MKKNKIVVDRPNLTSESINKHQDFDKVLKGANHVKPSFWKSPWFYGPVGLATVGLLITMSTLNEPVEEKEGGIAQVPTELPADTECIHKPVANLEVGYQEFEIDNLKGGEIVLTSGTKLTIPAKSLMTSGEIIEGKITIQIKELMNQSDNFIDGVLMDHKKDGAFISAGMIDVREKTKTGEKCEINQHKPIKVEMVLNDNPETFEFWRLNEGTKEWENHPVKYVTKSESPLNSKALLEKKIKEVDNAIYLNNESLSELQQPSKVEYKLPIQGKQRFDLDFESALFPELQQFKGMQFEVFTSEKYDVGFTKKTWNKVELKKENNNYFAEFKNSKEQFKIQVRPILTGQTMEKAEQKFNEALKLYEAQKQLLEEEAKNLNTQKTNLSSKYALLVKDLQKQKSVDYQEENKERKAYVANFYLGNFGYYNCDKENKYPKKLGQEIIFAYDAGQPVEIVNAFIFDQTNNVRYSFGDNYRHSLDQLGFDKNSENILMVIDRNGELGYHLKLDDLAIESGQIKLRKVGRSQQNAELFKKLLNETIAEL